jgi:hypothetical protein
MVPVLKSSDHMIDCACGNCGALLLLHAEDAQMIGTTRACASFFLNKFRKLGLTEYDGGSPQFLVEHVLLDTPRSKGGSTNQTEKNLIQDNP